MFYNVCFFDQSKSHIYFIPWDTSLASRISCMVFMDHHPGHPRLILIIAFALPAKVLLPPLHLLTGYDPHITLWNTSYFHNDVSYKLSFLGLGCTLSNSISSSLLLYQNWSYCLIVDALQMVELPESLQTRSESSVSH